MDESSAHNSDFHLCQACLEGEDSAIRVLQKRAGPVAINYLVGAGAERGEAVEVVEFLWGDLFTGKAGEAPRLARYNGNCSFQTWFNTVALNRLLTIKRKARRWQDLAPYSIDAAPADPAVLDRGMLADPQSAEPATALLVEVMRAALEHAFRNCGPEDFVLMQLKHCDRLLGAELEVMFGCDASGITRRLKKAQSQIATSTLTKIRELDPWLELEWEDFMELCRTATPACFGLD